MSDESALMQELRDLAGVKHGDTFRLERHGAKFDVKYSGGSSSSLTLSARYDAVAKGEGAGEIAGSYRERARKIGVRAARPMKITLRREQSWDAAAKNSGVNVEHQTGDKAFDDVVYIDSPTTSVEVLNGVLTEQVRIAARSLILLGFASVEIDDTFGLVSARLSEFSSVKAVGGRAPKMAEAFASLCNGLPPANESGEKLPPRPLPLFGWVTGVLAVVFLFAMMPALSFVATGLDCTDPSGDGEGVTFKSECGAPFLMGFLFGAVTAVVGGIITKRIVTPILKGRSDSSSRIGGISVVTGLLVGEVVFFTICVVGMMHR